MAGKQNITTMLRVALLLLFLTGGSGAKNALAQFDYGTTAQEFFDVKGLDSQIDNFNSRSGYVGFRYDVHEPVPVLRRASGSLIMWSMLIGFETVVLAGSLASRLETGAYIVGGFYGASAIGTIPLLFQQEFFPYITLTLGTAMLSWYNFTYAASHSPDRKFFTNFIGANAMAAAFVVGSLIQNSTTGSRNQRVSVMAGPGQVGLNLRF